MDSGIHAGMTMFSRSVGLVYNDWIWHLGTSKSRRHLLLFFYVASLRETFFLLPSPYGLAAHQCEYFFDSRNGATTQRKSKA